jgi:hypothetical protein
MPGFAYVSKAKQVLAEKLEVEGLHAAQPEALNAFTQHVEKYPVCSQRGAKRLLQERRIFGVDRINFFKS